MSNLKLYHHFKGQKKQKQMKDQLNKQFTIDDDDKVIIIEKKKNSSFGKAFLLLLILVIIILLTVLIVTGKIVEYLPI